MALSDVVREVQNPVLGGTLIWRFLVTYSHSVEGERECPFPLTFLVLPILLHEETATHVASTRKGSGLRKVVEKFGTSANRQTDILFSIHTRAKALRPLSLESIQIARVTKLISIETATGLVRPISYEKIKPLPSKPVQEMVGNAEKLGFWFSELTAQEIATILKVRF